ncbi:YdeI/OmpD-associated family protein [Variovorax terrae]|uniref:YdeI/OmpD-associated family protein n=1 Tax=Variovorax terrae TaxID=2923278 RepID=A0A9X1VQB0_9BURK|nr:YdeI/OmpD-associated family protein [Variovorax terrae]MCJ0761851.1 YdeI/OmpD-associated family protein [Variovorax terrae]
MATPRPELPVLYFEHAAGWHQWLARHHATSAGVWLRIARQDAGPPSLTYPQALDIALCHGWIDGQKQRGDEQGWLQKFTPRGARSLWSQRNRGKALALIEAGQMQPAGLREVERARQDGRWDAAYEAQGSATVPPDLAAALDASPRAKAFFATLDSRNRYAVLFRTQTAKKAETRARRIEQFVQMLARGEKLHP